MDAEQTKTWQATLTPHRSLTRQGFLVVMALIVVVNLVMAGFFVVVGAWPIAGFAGLDVLLLWWAFRVNFADAHKSERVCVTEHEVIVERWIRGREAEQQRFVRCWVRVELEEDHDRGLIGHLRLVSGQRFFILGDFLAPDERKTLATALRAALAVPRI